MKKLISIAILLTMLLASCGEAAQTPAGTADSAGTDAALAETEAETEDTYIHDSLPDADLGGYNFRIGTSEFGGKHLN